ncbi:ATPase, T2SS/T4P/T4SS family [Eubacterium oxidoreducens]|uniref:Pilus assembly protein CpaF n=1 Tax=Eubacterium oxidoreducens TaxID=1732 RepID=A0A1G6B3W9_EUBOX|nr:ATPase, T2SS/T4P/T4SS family [Eubacterium oxidoreducens]SDB15344.1 pilus assembly protein CpaF [Eubacterium oxidoreducens]
MQNKELKIEKTQFGPFAKYIENEDITDVDYNGRDIWLTNVKSGRKKISAKEAGVTQDFVVKFSQIVSNAVSGSLNQMNPVLEAETKTLRISIVHESKAVSGRSICLRKSLGRMRLTTENILEDKYLPPEALAFFINGIKAKLNFVFCGEPGAGKTEISKYVSQFINPTERVITIEDNLEWHYSSINPTADSVELKVDDRIFTYVDAIKACLRQNPKWIMLSEARSVEAKYLLESLSTGVHGITTIHCDDVRKVPARLLNMMESREDADRLENDAYEFIDVVALVRKKAKHDGTSFRYIDQIGLLSVENGEKKITMIMTNGKMTTQNLPSSILNKFHFADIISPFENAYVNDALNGQAGASEFDYRRAEDVQSFLEEEDNG